MELKRRAQSVCEHKDLEGDKKLEVQQTVKDTEQQRRTVLRAAEETRRYGGIFYVNVTVQATVILISNVIYLVP